MRKVVVTRPQCPKCGSRNIAQIRWGRQNITDELLEKEKRGEVRLVGCFLPKDSKNWHCNDCDHEFGKTGFNEIVRYNKKKKPDYIAAHSHSFMNRKEIIQSKKCGCFYCLQIFSHDVISEWIDDDSNEPTALCPYCLIDSVIGEKSEYPITKEFLQKMHDYWFDEQ